MQLEQAGIHYTAISGRDEVLPIRLGELHMNADAGSGEFPHMQTPGRTVPCRARRLRFGMAGDGERVRLQRPSSAWPQLSEQALTG